MHNSFWLDLPKILAINLVFSVMTPLIIGILDIKWILEDVSFAATMALCTFLSLNIYWFYWQRKKLIKFKAKIQEDSLPMTQYVSSFFQGCFIIIINSTIAQIVNFIIEWINGNIRIADGWNYVFIILFAPLGLFQIPTVWLVLLLQLPINLYIWQMIWNRRQKVLLQEKIDRKT